MTEIHAIPGTDKIFVSQTRPETICQIWEVAREFYQNPEFSNSERKAFGAGALWVLNHLLVETDKLPDFQHIPLTAENVFAEMENQWRKKKFCKTCEKEHVIQLLADTIKNLRMFRAS